MAGPRRSPRRARRSDRAMLLSGLWGVGHLADELLIDRRLAGELLARLEPAERTAGGWPLYTLAAALPALRPDLARQLAPVLRCRLVARSSPSNSVLTPSHSRRRSKRRSSATPPSSRTRWSLDRIGQRRAGAGCSGPRKSPPPG